MSIPLRFRTLIRETNVASRADQLYFVPWLQECLLVFSANGWEAWSVRMERRIAAVERHGYSDEAMGLRRMVFGQSEIVEMDQHGRIVLPTHLREDGQLRDAIYWVGVGDNLELWGVEAWRARMTPEYGRGLREVLIRVERLELGTTDVEPPPTH